MDENFRNDKITITRDELAEVVACETIRVLKNAQKRVEDGDASIDVKTIDMVQSLLMMFGADIMTVLFDESNVGSLEIEHGEHE